MARIPTGNFGNALPGRVPQVQSSPGTFGAGTARAVERLGATGAQIGIQREADETRERDQDLALARQEQDKAERVKAGLRLHEGELSLRERATALADRVLSGAVRQEDAMREWSEGEAELLTAQTEDVAADLRPGITNGLRLRARELAGTVLRQAGRSRVRSEIKAGLVGSIELLEREAMDDRGKALARAEQLVVSIGPDAGLSPEDQFQTLQRFREKTAYAVGSKLVRTARDDLKALDGVMTRITSAEFDDLSNEQVGQLEQQVLSRKQTLAAQEQARIARAEAWAAKHDREARSTIEATQALIDNGAVPDAAYTAKAQQAVRGTPFAAVFDELLRQGGEQAGFAARPPAEQRAAILTLRAKANAQGSNPELEKRLATMERLHEATETQLTQEPLMYGVNRRLIPAVEPLQFTSIEDLTTRLGQRVDQAATVGARTGRQVSPLMRAEAKALGTMLGVFPVEQRATALKTLSSAIGNPDQLRALAAQMETNNRPLMLAMTAAAKRSAPGDELVELILRGHDAETSGRVKVDATVKQAQTQAAQLIAEIPWATPQARDAAADAAAAVVVGMRDSKRSGSAREAVRMAVGEIAEWGGAKVPVPFGWSERQFRQAMREISPARLSMMSPGPDVFTLRGEQMTSEQLAAALPQLQLQPAGEGQYVLLSGGALVGASNGRPFRLRVGD